MLAVVSPAKKMNFDPLTEARNESQSAFMAETKKLMQVKAPMSGVFYKGPSPEEPAYVEVGDVVKKKQVIGLRFNLVQGRPIGHTGGNKLKSE